jgi:tRNA pseudouridine38-40 synthase
VIHHYRLLLQYKGTRYLGWQVQPEGKTVQGELNRALAVISKSPNVKSLGAGRTDAGVHALGQVAKVGLELAIPAASLLKALNANLPEDIRVLDAEPSDEHFFPTVHARSKEYHYRFKATRDPGALHSELIANCPFELDLGRMREACEALIGVHDFSNFYCVGTEVAHNVREIFACELLVVPQAGWMLPEHYVFRIVGSGFLKQMVRLLVGAVWSVGRGKTTLEEFRSALSPAKVPRLGPVAPACGLYMVRVNY